MVVTGENAVNRRVVYLDADVVKWRIRCRMNDMARIYLLYADRLEERCLVVVDDERITPGGLVAVNRWSTPKTQTNKNFWAI